ncbi:uncharacterized protein LOC111715385 isoform X2 [Eurytemora carolleeae]|uniref:uncharacterized protein LOC111715385 isoform X2 n=1 Tax=Eurytemora carolleeae TaxID=1294199 RepID=UPI000C75B8B3|nr:uncharacterized protein LOC111715385 isoform X2 [Eurytemora carolleeae]|eukprot:XP_023346464.1 uncharacterized protein LOC111715385 isoform X2 [Eurytemora affinis]
MILLTLIGSVFVQIAHSQSSGCGILHEGEPGAGGLWRTIQTSDPYFGGTEREYLIYIPSTYTPDNPSPLVLDFHGWGGSADWHIKDSLWDAVGEEEGLIIVVPNGIPDAESGTRTWNITKEYDTEYGWRCDPDRSEYGENECHTSCSEWCNPAYGCTAGTTCYNDQAFIEQLIQNIQETYCVDNKHVHISGYSNGGTFTYRMFSYSHLNLGGFGSVSGAPFIGRGDVPYPARSLIDFHGLDDWTVPRQYDHSPGEGPLGDVRTIMSWDALYYYYTVLCTVYCIGI